ncbi:hypothetical protein BDF21DRAFT_419541 [Thamnidium elegans]|nr:hypothetical protein BDF21DRAFT_419541 [Thamnidium elegans]
MYIDEYNMNMDEYNMNMDEYILKNMINVTLISCPQLRVLMKTIPNILPQELLTVLGVLLIMMTYQLSSRIQILLRSIQKRSSTYHSKFCLKQKKDYFKRFCSKPKQNLSRQKKLLTRFVSST